jgi:hypothetical protein
VKDADLELKYLWRTRKGGDGDFIPMNEGLEQAIRDELQERQKDGHVLKPDAPLCKSAWVALPKNAEGFEDGV